MFSPSTTEEEKDDRELYDRRALPKREYELLRGESAVPPRRDDLPREWGPTPPVRFATMRDHDVEKGRARF